MNVIKEIKSDNALYVLGTIGEAFRGLEVYSYLGYELKSSLNAHYKLVFRMNVRIVIKVN